MNPRAGDKSVRKRWLSRGRTRLPPRELVGRWLRRPGRDCDWLGPGHRVLPHR